MTVLGWVLLLVLCAGLLLAMAATDHLLLAAVTAMGYALLSAAAWSYAHQPQPGPGAQPEARPEVGGDWVVVRYSDFGYPYRCFKLREVWLETGPNHVRWVWPDGQEVQWLGGSAAVARVRRDQWAAALSELGLDDSTCEVVQRMRYNALIYQYEARGGGP